MAVKVNEYTREDGHVIVVYESGAEYDTTDKRLVKAPPKHQITAENATIYKRRRQEKAAAALRARILETTKAKSTLPLNSSAEAVAEAGAYIWDEVVLGLDVYPRDRLDAWEKLSKYAGILPTDKRTDDSPSTVAAAAAIGAGVASALERVLRDVRQAQERDIVDATAVDSDREQDRTENGV